MDIGSRIKKRREYLEMSQEELAHKVGYKSRSSINKIESDGRGLPQKKILAFADALDTSPAYLMGWTSNPNVSSLKGNITPISAIKCDTDDEKKLLLSYRTLSAPSKKKVLSYCNGLADIEKADFELNAAHALPYATTEDKLHDEDIMNDDDF